MDYDEEEAKKEADQVIVMFRHLASQLPAYGNNDRLLMIADRLVAKYSAPVRRSPDMQQASGVVGDGSCGRLPLKI